jgi:hypothetical protein
VSDRRFLEKQPIAVALHAYSEHLVRRMTGEPGAQYRFLLFDRRVREVEFTRQRGQSRGLRFGEDVASATAGLTRRRTMGIRSLLMAYTAMHFVLDAARTVVFPSPKSTLARAPVIRTWIGPRHQKLPCWCQDCRVEERCGR